MQRRSPRAPVATAFRLLMQRAERAVAAGILALLVLALTCQATTWVRGAEREHRSPVSLGPVVGRPTALATEVFGPAAEPTGGHASRVAASCPAPPDGVPADWAAVMCDSFDRNLHAWDVGIANLDVATLDRTVAGGAYRWNLDARRPLLAWSSPAFGALADFYAAVDVRLSSGLTDGVDFGLALGARDVGNMLLFLVSPIRGVTLRRGLGEASNAIVDWTSVPDLRPNDWNRLAAKSSGPNLSLYVNGRLVGAASAGIAGERQFSIAAQARQPGQFVVEFDNFEGRAAPGTVIGVAASTPESPPRPASEQANPPAAPLAAHVQVIPPGSAPASPPVWPIVFSEAFKDNGNGWSLGEDFGRGWEASKVVDGTLAWQYKAAAGTHAVIEVPWSAVADFYAATDVKRYDGPENVWRGLVFRRADSYNCYSFLVNDTRQYKILALIRDNWYDLIASTHTEAIRPNEWNKVAVKAQGAELTFFINDQAVVGLRVDQQDILLLEGAVALALEAHGGGVGIVEFDNVELRVPGR